MNGFDSGIFLPEIDITLNLCHTCIFLYLLEDSNMLNTTLILVHNTETDFLFLAIACVIVRKLSGMANYPTGPY